MTAFPQQRLIGSALCCALILLGCASTNADSRPATQTNINAQATANAIGSNWYSQPPQDTPQFMYGVGEAYNRELAQQQALADIAGRLSTEVTASLARSTNIQNDNTIDRIQRDMVTRVSAIELGQFELIKTAQNRNYERVLIRLDKTKLANLWRERIDFLEAQLLPMLTAQQISSLRGWLALRNMLPKAQEIDTLRASLLVLNGTPLAPSAYQATEQQLASHQLEIGVQGEHQRLNRAIEQAFLTAGLKTCQPPSCPIVLSYSSGFERQSMFGQFISNMFLQSTVTEGTTVVANADMRAQAGSVASYDAADNGAINSVINKITQDSVWTTFGLQP